MTALLLIFAIWCGLTFFGVRPLIRLGVVAALWLGVIALLAMRPHMTGIGRIEAWLIGGGLLAIILGYRWILGLMQRRAEAGGDHGPGLIGGAPVVSDKMSEAELDRYARHIVLRELGGPGQRKLRQAKVLIVGAGALGSPVGLYLAAAGVGHITIADDDTVSLSNLQRQVAFSDRDTGRSKAVTMTQRLQALNPHIKLTPLVRRISAEDEVFIRDFDLILDGTDSFASRAAVNAAAAAAGVPVVAGSIAQWEGQLTIWDPAHGAPCMACVFPVAPAPGLAPSCAEAGVVGALPGVIGSMMALEAIKLIAGAGDAARGRMLIFDGLWGETRSIRLARDPACPVCARIDGEQP